MDLVYCVDISKSKPQKDWVAEERYCTSISCRNIVALSKPTETDDSAFEQRCVVEVFDLDKPWDSFHVTTSASHVVQLHWDPTGSKLIIIDDDSNCQVWAMEDHLLNKWTSIGSVSIEGEDVLSAIWFHNGLQVIFDPDKRDKTQYMEKFQRNPRLKPSLSQFGGSHIDGFIAVTASGLISVSVILDEDEIVSAKECLAPCHLRLTTADIANTGNGDIMVATSDGQLSSAIQCYLISVKLVQKTVNITCKNSASLYTKTQMEYGSNESQIMRTTKVAFMNSESSDTLFVCCGSSTYSCLEVWQLLEQMMPLHKMFAMNTAPDTMNKTHKWMHKATISQASSLTSIAGPKLPMSRNVVETSGFLPYIALSYKDGTLQLIHRYTFQVISTSNIDSICQQVQPYSLTGEKKQKLSMQLSAVVQTGSGCGILGLNAGRLYLFRTFNSSRDTTMQLTPSSVVLLLEYAMVSGLDWWDIFLSVRQGMIMNVCQSLTDNFSKQTLNMQEYVFMPLLSMKMGLFSSYSAGHQKAVDYHTRLVLHAIGNTIKGVLKPKNVSSNDKSPGEKVSQLCNKHTDGDIDNVITLLDKEEFHVDIRQKDKSEVSLYNIQSLIQWVSDFCLQLLTSVPLYQSYSSFSGSSLLSDSSVLGLLRELLVIFKVWGNISPGCLPTFTSTSVNFDPIKHLFKLLTRAWTCCKEGRSIEYDDTLQDECAVLPSKLLIPSINQSFHMDCNGFMVFTQQLPLMFKSGDTPDFILQRSKSKPHKFVTDTPINNNQKHDIVRQIHLGTRPSESMRQCCRCGCYSLLKSTANSQIMKAWEQRWVKQCLCGGHWKLAKVQ